MYEYVASFAMACSKDYIYSYSTIYGSSSSISFLISSFLINKQSSTHRACAVCSSDSLSYVSKLIMYSSANACLHGLMRTRVK